MRFSSSLWVSLIVLSPLAAACASQSAPPPQSATSQDAPASGASGSSDGKSGATGLDSMKSEIRDFFCKGGSPIRACFAIPSDDACVAAFDAAWPDCTKGVVIHEGPNAEDEAAGNKAGQCIGGAIAKQFKATPTEACKKAAQGAK
jgi:hypothetical protein